ncbi:AmiR/NasT family two-component response regulator [Paeniglutamicibacter psychrophenolicus]|nr:AmiR/NasT family two-component response regulator [Paeniglutamicibacter psychrophenolicus]
MSRVLAVPLVLEEGAVAVLGLYSADPKAFTGIVVRGAERNGHHARKALLLARRITSKAQVAQDLEAAMESRTAIDPAVGIIMGQQRCSQDEAFTFLSRAASNRNQKPRTVAAGLEENLNGTGAKTHFET